MLNDMKTGNKRHNYDSLLEILLFTSPLCGPCPKMEQRLLETINKRNLPIKVTKIDILSAPEATELAEKYDIIACPTLIFRDFMKVCGCYEREEIEELIVTYFASAFEFQRVD
jgi:predicted DsbA family dithiol-disulfide isomerase